MKDGLVLFYVKANKVYPVALTKEQAQAFEIIQQVIPQPIHVLNEPVGEAVDLTKK